MTPNLYFKSISLLLVIKSYDVITTAGSMNCSLVFDNTYIPVTGISGILKQISSSHVYLIKIKKYKKFLMIIFIKFKITHKFLPHT